MQGRSAPRLTMILALVAALLAFPAAGVGYANRREFDPRPVGGGLFMLALAVGAWTRLRRSPAA